MLAFFLYPILTFVSFILALKITFGYSFHIESNHSTVITQKSSADPALRVNQCPLAASVDPMADAVPFRRLCSVVNAALRTRRG